MALKAVARFEMARASCLKSLRVLLSFTPGFSPVIKDRENYKNRFNDFSVRLCKATALYSTTPVS
jgi:hypothetical protein